ncbi:hypothetical protein VTO42DRAFT_1485 [Malbranchea cinnamomea]
MENKLRHLKLEICRLLCRVVPRSTRVRTYTRRDHCRILYKTYKGFRNYMITAASQLNDTQTEKHENGPGDSHGINYIQKQNQVPGKTKRPIGRV